MKTLEPPDTHHLSAAVGWVELGNAAEAEAELACVNPALRDHPGVLEVRWLVLAKREDWVEGLAIARQLVRTAPDLVSGWLHQAYALRRVPDGGLQQAWDALLPAFNLFPAEPTIPFNLSCYACQMGRLDDARVWLKRALKIGGRDHIKAMALADADLEPLHNEIRSI